MLRHAWILRGFLPAVHIYQHRKQCKMLTHANVTNSLFNLFFRPLLYVLYIYALSQLILKRILSWAVLRNYYCKHIGCARLWEWIRIQRTSMSTFVLNFISIQQWILSMYCTKFVLMQPANGFSVSTMESDGPLYKRHNRMSRIKSRSFGSSQRHRCRHASSWLCFLYSFCFFHIFPASSVLDITYTNIQRKS